MLTLLLALTACTYDEEYSCEPWAGWWSGALHGDLEGRLVGELHAYYDGAFTPGGGGGLLVTVREVDLAGVLGATEAVYPSQAFASAAVAGGECEAAWKGTLGVVAELVVQEPSAEETAPTDTGDTGDTGTAPGDTGTAPGDTGTTDTATPEPGIVWSGTLSGALPDPGEGTWSLSGSDGSSLSGSWSLAFDQDFPSSAE